MTKKDTLQAFEAASYVTLKCTMCGEKLREFAHDTDTDDLAERAWKAGWRVQNWAVLCQHCKDNKR